MFGVKGYAITSHWRNDKIDRNIHNWKVFKLPDRGRHTFLDDVMKDSKRKMEQNPTKY